MTDGNLLQLIALPVALIFNALGMALIIGLYTVSKYVYKVQQALKAFC